MFRLDQSDSNSSTMRTFSTTFLWFGQQPWNRARQRLSKSVSYTSPEQLLTLQQVLTELEENIRSTIHTLCDEEEDCHEFIHSKVEDLFANILQTPRQDTHLRWEKVAAPSSFAYYRPARRTESLAVNRVIGEEELGEGASTPVDLAQPASMNECAPTASTTSSQTNEDTIEFIEPCSAHGIIKDIPTLQPTMNEWADFPRILQRVALLDGDDCGVCRVILPSCISRASTACSLSPHQSKARCYNVEKSNDLIYTLKFETQSKCTFKRPSKSASAPIDPESRFEGLLRDSKMLSQIRYRTDIDIRKDQERADLGLPVSIISNLRNNRLSNSRVSIPGLSTAYAYESNDHFGAPFALHCEDWNLWSINHLHIGIKRWIVIPPNQRSLLESRLRSSNFTKMKQCSQFVRHLNIYISTHLLDAWSISYCAFFQHANEIVILRPKTYHQGFSCGYTLAEAVNYADSGWDVEDYSECSKSCPKEKILWHHIEPIENNAAMGRSNSQNTKRAHQHADSGGSISKSKKGVKDSAHEKGAKAPKLRPMAAISQSLKAGQLSLPYQIDLPEILAKEVSSLVASLSEVRSDHLASLISLHLAIGSADAIAQLNQICRFTKDLHNPQLVRPRTISEALDFIDGLDSSMARISIAKRVCLVRLVEMRNQSEEIHKNYSGPQTRQNAHYIDNSRSTSISKAKKPRPNIQALDDLMRSAYPRLEPGEEQYQKQRAKLIATVNAGQNWHSLKMSFGIGVLALIPIEGDFGVSNTR